jgi:hypothetical protein
VECRNRAWKRSIGIGYGLGRGRQVERSLERQGHKLQSTGDCRTRGFDWESHESLKSVWEAVAIAMIRLGTNAVRFLGICADVNEVSNPRLGVFQSLASWQDLVGPVELHRCYPPRLETNLRDAARPPHSSPIFPWRGTCGAA